MQQRGGNLVEELQQRGMRVTPQRAIIFDAIEQLDGHITAEDIYQQVKRVNPYISLATVYRTLELLQDLNLITPTNLGGSQTYFALEGHGEHHHMVCHICGKIEEFSDSFLNSLRDDLKKYHEFTPKISHMSIFGVCAACRHTDNGNGHPG
jgi:Fur family ferric uptake transcriptional regulator